MRKLGVSSIPAIVALLCREPAVGMSIVNLSVDSDLEFDLKYRDKYC